MKKISTTCCTDYSSDFSSGAIYLSWAEKLNKEMSTRDSKERSIRCTKAKNETSDFRDVFNLFFYCPPINWSSTGISYNVEMILRALNGCSLYLQN